MQLATNNTCLRGVCFYWKTSLIFPPGIIPYRHSSRYFQIFPSSLVLGKQICPATSNGSKAYGIASVTPDGEVGCTHLPMR